MKLISTACACLVLSVAQNVFAQTESIADTDVPESTESAVEAGIDEIANVSDDIPCLTIAQLLDEPTLSTLKAAVEAANLTNVLDAIEPGVQYTVFAPTDTAFNNTPEGTVEFLVSPEGAEDLLDLLLYHTLQGVDLSFDVKNSTAEMLNGQNITVAVADNRTVTINDDAHIVQADISACNGVVHIIDSVLTPPERMEEESESMEPSASAEADDTEEVSESNAEEEVEEEEGGKTCNTLADFLDLPSLSTLKLAVTTANLTSQLTALEPGVKYTMFAPTDAAFGELSDETLEYLMSAEGAEDLVDALLYHVAKGVGLYDEVLAAMQSAGSGDVVLPVLNGQNVTVALEDDEITINGASIVTRDLVTCNGVLHIIDTVLMSEESEVDAEQETGVIAGEQVDGVDVEGDAEQVDGVDVDEGENPEQVDGLEVDEGEDTQQADEEQANEGDDTEQVDGVDVDEGDDTEQVDGVDVDEGDDT
ncbi:hypothetical protein, variant 1, partial [Sphaeroforma arctica JP610]